MSDELPRDPGPATADSSDWTWVLTRPCPDCGFDASRLRPPEVPGILRDAEPRFGAVLERPDVRERPSAGTWSPLEYCCHVRDVCTVMTGRLEQILAGGGALVRFADWDQDEAERARQYWRAEPEQVGPQLAARLDRAADRYAVPTGGQWAWPALRSNGSRFTAETLAQYFLHEVTHHLWDVRG
ncbi:MAG TPA: DinB family protein [Segeticoccus sp.]|nr:DinB family protein [Segeticoccus sp.]